MTKSFPLRVAIIGAGRVGTALFRAIVQAPDVQILGIADTRADAPGLRVATDYQLPVTTEPLSLIAHPDADLILDLTGDPGIPNLVERHKQPGACLLTGPATVLLWSLLEKTTVLQRAVDDAHDAMFHLDLEGTILWANRQAERVSGRSLNTLLHQPFVALLSPSSAAQAEAQLRAIRAGQDVEPLAELEVRQPDGRMVPVEASEASFRVAGQISGQILVLRDLTERKYLQTQLLLYGYMAYHDPLTGLPNRALFLDRARQAKKRTSRRPDQLFAMLLMDLDHFKSVNDSLGHLAGDQCLVSLSQRLVKCLRPGDTAARLGGDEFAILIESLSEPSSAIHVADRLHQELAAPIVVNGQEISVTVSIGGACWEQRYDQPEDLFRDADTAMYRAKELGGARTVLFDRSIHV